MQAYKLSKKNKMINYLILYLLFRLNYYKQMKHIYLASIVIYATAYVEDNCICKSLYDDEV